MNTVSKKSRIPKDITSIFLFTVSIVLTFLNFIIQYPFGLLSDPDITNYIRGSKFEDPGQLRLVDPGQSKVTKGPKIFRKLMEKMIGRGNLVLLVISIMLLTINLLTSYYLQFYCY